MLLGVPAAFVLVRHAGRAATARPAGPHPLAADHAAHRRRGRVLHLYARIGLVGTSLGLVLGHTVLAVPYVVITMMAVLKTYDERLDQAAASLGARPGARSSTSPSR